MKLTLSVCCCQLDHPLLFDGALGHPLDCIFASEARNLVGLNVYDDVLWVDSQSCVAGFAGGK